jgi:cell division protein FtsI/penicillin-binding protein 2
MTFAAAGCGSHRSKDDYQAALTSSANDLAAALVSSKLTDVPLTGTTPAKAAAERKKVYAQLPTKPDVTVKSVTTVKDSDGKDHHDSAVATLTWSWPLGGKKWTYTTTADMVRSVPTSSGEQTASPAPVWQVRWSPTILLAGLGTDQHVTVARVRPKRANILDGNGKAIVKDRPVHLIGIDKTHASAKQWSSSATQLATALGLDASAYAAQVKAASPQAFVQAIVLRDSDPTNLGPLRAIPGVNIVDDSIPLAPTRTWARAVLGSVGDATAQTIKDSGGRVAAGDEAGLSGLEEKYDAQLAGTAGITVTLADDKSDASSSDTKTLYKVRAVAGTPLKLTLDSGLQSDAEKILSTPKSASALVAIDTSGKVLTVASGTASNGMSTATLGRYAPGSTMKIASSLALLQQGDTPSSKVTCPPTLTVDGRSFSDDAGYPADAYGTITLRSAFANSCNTAFMGQAKNVSQKQLHDAAADLGLGVPSALGAPAFFGNVPAASTSGTDHASSMIGQGRIEASPLAMANVAASVAAGHRVSPVLVTNPDASGGAGESAPSATASAAPSSEASASASAQSTAPSKLTAGQAKALHSLMRSVVTGGTGTLLDSLPNEVAAKTGTAQYGANGDKQHAWMVAIDGKVAVAAFVFDGSYGATSAGPLLKSFLQDVDAAGLAKG